MDVYLIAHDLGTSGNKATLFTGSGELIRSATYAYTTRFFNGNWAEQDPRDWWKAVCETTKKLLRGLDPAKIAGISFSGQMMACVCIDRQGKPLRDAIIWADQRAVEQEALLREKIPEKEFYRITGHKISAAYTLEKLMWVRDKQPEVFKEIYKVLQPKDYIIYLLTGRLTTDYSDASGTNAFDLNRLEWSERILSCAEISGELLPVARPSTCVAGEVTTAAAGECGLLPGTPVVIGGGDGVCAAVGAGSVRENVAYNYIGSSSWISYTAREPLFDPEMRTFNWAHIVPGYYAPTGTMQAAGNTFNFMIDTVCRDMWQDPEKSAGLYDSIDREIASSTPGANGLIFLPYLLGERSPRWNPDARGALIGLKMENTRADMMRAAVEGIAMNLDVILNVFRKDASIEEINVLGGIAKSNVICSILADVFNSRICRLNYLEEATSIGAAVTAGVGTGVFKRFDQVEGFIKKENVLLPDAMRSKKYEQVKYLFEKAYDALKPVYELLADNS